MGELLIIFPRERKSCKVQRKQFKYLYWKRGIQCVFEGVDAATGSPLPGVYARIDYNVVYQDLPVKCVHLKVTGSPDHPTGVWPCRNARETLVACARPCFLKFFVG